MENITFPKPIYKVAAQGGSYWLLNRIADTEDTDPCVVIAYADDLFPTPVIEAKYDKAATPMTFNAYDIFDEGASYIATDFLNRKLTTAQMKEINDFLTKT